MSWNVFKFCTALRGLGSVMIVLVLGVVGVTYYALVVINYVPSLFHGGLESLIALAVLLLFHSLVKLLFFRFMCFISSWLVLNFWFDAFVFFFGEKHWERVTIQWILVFLASLN